MYRLKRFKVGLLNEYANPSAKPKRTNLAYFTAAIKKGTNEQPFYNTVKKIA